MKEIKYDEWMGMVKELNAGQPSLKDLINKQAEGYRKEAAESKDEAIRKLIDLGGEIIKIGPPSKTLLNPLEITEENPFEPMEEIEDEYDPMDAMEEAHNDRPCFMDELEEDND